MLRKRHLNKKIAATLLVLWAVNTLAPGVSYALTAGPTLPEATSFEPVDTSDLVNLQTGDFSYNLPLLEVSSPEGGYPLSLSYHAGIQPNEEASWSGLGWTVNPGAINRTISGYPDDYKGIDYIQRTYWAGGETHGGYLGASYNTGGVASVSAGLSFSQDTYKGFGIGGNVGIGMVLDQNFGVSASLGISPYGDPYGSLGVSYTMGIPELKSNLGLGVAIHTNFKSVGVSGSLTLSGGQNSLGISLNSKNAFPTFSVGGYSVEGYVKNSNAGNISTESFAFGISFPVTPTVTASIGYNYKRYWSDETKDIKTYGTLYTQKGNFSNQDNAFDAYGLVDYPNKNIIDDPEIFTHQGGVFPDFDNYSVLAQGLSGNIRPYIYRAGMGLQTLFKPDYQVNPIVQYENTYNNDLKRHFRFINDFSNRYIQENNDFHYKDNRDFASFPFDSSPLYGKDNYNFSSGKLSGSSDVQYYTNQEILDGVARSQGFSDVADCYGYDRTANKYRDISYRVLGSRPETPEKLETFLEIETIEDDSYPDQIGAFSITKSDGIVYHYALPVYNYDQVFFSEKIDGSPANGGYSNSSQNIAKSYAYTWLLTAITGPDYVDFNFNGKVDSVDLGYWVRFDYGKWSNEYTWRNPSEGHHRDLDNEYRNFSAGKKEIYYLNAIKTRTHTAIFEKGVRQDGTGSLSSDLENYDLTNNRYSSIGAFDPEKNVLKLDRIYLFTNDQLPSITPSTGLVPGTINNMPVSQEYANNVIDNYDINAFGRELFTSKALRVIDFTYDYSLCKNTANSYASGKGKLTLKKVQMRGKGGAAILPPVKFEYEEEERVISGMELTGQAASSDPLEIGELLILNEGSGSFAGVVENREPVLGAYGKYIYTVANGDVPIESGRSYRTTKNPPYNKDRFDIWGMYKSDANLDLINENENMGRRTTLVSARSLDVWSLRKIDAGLGSVININYESDTYQRIAIENYSTVIIDEFEYNSSNQQLTLKLKDNFNQLPDLSDFYSVGTAINFIAGLSDHILFPNKIYTIMNTKELASTPSVISVNNADKSIVIDASMIDYPNHLLKGNLIFNPPSLSYGGGIRVKDIAIESGGEISRLSYNYAIPGSANSSGATTYEPYTLSLFPERIYFLSDNLSKSYKKQLYEYLNNLLNLSRILPTPGALYEYVTVSRRFTNKNNVDKQFPGSVTYQFEVFQGNMIDRAVLSSYEQPQVNGSNVYNYLKNMAFRNSLSRLGCLKRTVTYGTEGKKLTETINHYLHDNLVANEGPLFYSNYETLLDTVINNRSFHKQGLIKERYGEAKSRYADDKIYQQTTMSSWESYPLVPTGTTFIDYVNGIQSTTENLAFDFYSGAVTETVKIDANGNRYKSKIVPAYHLYSAMGIKNVNIGNKNMLTQRAADYTFLVDSDNDSVGLVGASINTWSNEIDVLMPGNYISKEDGVETGVSVWRPKMTYNWASKENTSNGITSIGLFVDFYWTAQNDPTMQSTGWVKTSEVTLYDAFSNPLEASDVNGQFAATKMGYSSSKVLITGAPAKYAEIAYSGAEDAPVSNRFNGDFYLGAATVQNNPLYVHTGERSVRLPNGIIGFQYEVPVSKLDNTRDYWASVWIKTGTENQANAGIFYNNGSGQINGTLSSLSPGGWRLATLSIPASAITGSDIVIGCYNNSGAVVYFDDIRFHPVNAAVTTYVYDNFSGELTYVLDNNNFFTKYDYDAAGRLIKTWRETQSDGVRPVSEFQYHYNQTDYNSQPDWKATGLVRCVTNSEGVATGAQEKQEIDDNPLSISHNQTRWTLDNNPAINCQIGDSLSVYVKLAFRNIIEFDNKLYADIYFEFYNDNLYTIPVSVEDFPVTIGMSTTCEGTPIFEPLEIICNGTSTNFYSGVVIAEMDIPLNCELVYEPPIPPETEGHWIEMCEVGSCTYDYFIVSPQNPLPEEEEPVPVPDPGD